MEYLKILYKNLECKKYDDAKVIMDSIIEELSNITQSAFVTHKLDEFVEID